MDRLFRWQCTLLEAFMPPNWFATSHRKHRAYRRWELCKALAENGGKLATSAPPAAYQEIVSTMLDTLLLSKVSGSDYEQNIVGSFERYGDKRFSAFRRSRVLEPQGFDDLMTELAYGAWEVMQGAHVDPIELQGQADMLVNRVSTNFRVVAECKRLTVSTPNRVQAIVKKANKQIRNTLRLVPGLLIVDITPALGGRDRPNDVNVGDELETLFQGAVGTKKNRAISAVVLVWDHYEHVVSSTGRVEGLLQRRRQVIHHNVPDIPWPASEPLFDGLTAYSDSKFVEADIDHVPLKASGGR